MGRTRGLIQAWAAASSVLFALVTLAIVSAYAMAVLAPGRFRSLCLQGSEYLAKLPDAFSDAGPATVDPQESRAERPQSRGDEAPAPKSDEARSAFESRVEKLEADVALLRAVPGTATLPERARIALSRLEAWESLREPIFRLLGSFADGDPAAALPDLRADIRTIAADLAARMERAARSRREAAGALAGRLSGSEFLRLALDERVLPSSQAVECFFLLPPTEASRVLGRLALVRPELGARIIQDLRRAADFEKKTVVQLEK